MKYINALDLQDRQLLKQKPNLVGLDIETTGLVYHEAQVLCATVKIPEIPEVIFFDLTDPAGVEKLQKISHWFRDGITIAHNALFDVPFMRHHFGLEFNRIHCTLTMEKVALGGKGLENKTIQYGLAPTLLRRYGIKLNKAVRGVFGDGWDGQWTQEKIDYACEDTEYLLRLYQDQLKNIGSDSMIYHIESKATHAMIQMIINGIPFSFKQWVKVYNQNKEKYDKLLDGYLFKKYAINWNSRQQVLEVFNDKLGLNLPNLQEATVEAIDVSGLKVGVRNIVSKFKEFKKLGSMLSKFGTNYADFISEQGRIHASYQQFVSTSRMSCSQPNLQQVVGDEEYRNCFRAEAGKKLVVADFSGQELGVLAALSGEQIWVDAFLTGRDLHSTNAAMLFGSRWDEAAEPDCRYAASGQKCSCPNHKSLRDISKTLSFGLVYGMGYGSLAARTGITEQEAKALYDQFFVSYPKIRSWTTIQGRRGVDSWKVNIPKLGYTRVLTDKEDFRRKNQAVNTPIQGLSAAMTKIALVNAVKKDLKVIAAIHDEILIECPEASAEAEADILRECMEGAADWITGIKGLIKAEPNITTVWKK